MKTAITALAILAATVCAGEEPDQIREFSLGDIVTTEEAAAQPAGPAPVETGDAVDQQLEAMDLRRRIAQLMLVTLQGSPQPDSQDRALLKRLPPGGVVVPQMLRPDTVADYTKALRALAAADEAGIPLLIGTNLFNLPLRRKESSEFFPPLPSLLGLAATGDRGAADSLADIMGEQLSLMGCNFLLGPSLSLAPTIPEAPGTIQCLGSDAGYAAEVAGAFVGALAEHGVLTMPMHFPGGAANRAEKRPAVLLTPANLLPVRDLLPFRQAIEDDVPLIHVGNTLVPTIDPTGEPASLSPQVMTRLLRDALGYEGIIVAGPFDVPEIAQKCSPSEAAVRALQAGADMLYWQSAGQGVVKVIDYIAGVVEDGALSEESINASCRRILQMKHDEALQDRPLPTTQVAAKIAKNEDYRRATYAIERQSVTVVQNRNATLPLTKKLSVPLAVTGSAGFEVLAGALTPALETVVRQPIVSAKHGDGLYDFEVQRIVTRAKGARTVVCAITGNLEPEGPAQLVRELKENGSRVVIVLIGYPKNLLAVRDADAIVLAYANPDMCEWSMKAVADVLLGQGPLGMRRALADVQTVVGREMVFNALNAVWCPTGRLPVDIEPPYTSGLAVPYDPSLAIKKVRWQFGQGSRSRKIVARKTFDKAGTYPVTLTVRDNAGDMSARVFNVTVQ